VVTVVDGDGALQRCLTALTGQEEPPPMEIVVPWDATIGSAEPWARMFPAVQFLDLGRLSITHDPSTPRGQHELFDRRRAIGLAVAHGSIVAIVEDRGVPRADWAAAFMRLHDTLPNAAIGGAIENGYDRILNWAVYFCDFGRYQLPFRLGPREYISDVNIAYKRQALDRTRELWKARYHEPVLHDALHRAGETLLLAPDPVVDEFRDGLRLLPVLRERIAWGRLFGALRVQHAPLTRRLALAAMSPLVPGVLFGRFLRDRIAKRTPIGRLLATAPIVGVLLCAWTIGEVTGYVTGSR
jgi:hypothetical protein